MIALKGIISDSVSFKSNVFPALLGPFTNRQFFFDVVLLITDITDLKNFQLTIAL